MPFDDEIAEMVNVPSGGWPMINQGSHLTVKTFKDGRTELIWDDEALLNEVKAAILTYESRINC
jgi:predicted component of type VI protein secretion system